ncbi:uncharacterized protein METZ01_LOCUS272381 [marine metagenome]|uniref:Uncharacterized protein n=1 Tax=marine metagenome TaxID=408172 RepID=A0A382K911_9ZZZZ
MNGLEVTGCGLTVTKPSPKVIK